MAVQHKTKAPIRVPFRFGCGDEVVSGRSKPLPYHDCGATLRTVEDACPYKRRFTTYKKYDIINPKIHKRKAYRCEKDYERNVRGFYKGSL